MKWKYFLRGLGCGILIATLVLCIAYRKNSRDSLNVVQEAKKLGMVFPEGTSPPDEIIEATKEPEESEEPSATATEEESTEKPSATAESSVTKEPAKTETPTKTKTPKATKAPTKKSSKKSTKKKVAKSSTVRFQLRDASSSIAAARELEAAGLISSAVKFDSYMQEKGYTPRVRAGTYNIPKDASFEEIAKIITHQT